MDDHQSGGEDTDLNPPAPHSEEDAHNQRDPEREGPGPQNRHALCERGEPRRLQIADDFERRLVPGRRPRVPGDDRRVRDQHEDRDGENRENPRELQPQVARRDPMPKEPRLRLHPAPERDQRPQRLAPLHPRDHRRALARIAEHPGQKHDRDDREDDRREQEQPLANRVRQLVDALREEVAQQDEPRRPEPGPQHAVREERAVPHPRATSDERRHRAHEADEPSDQDRLPPVPLEVPLHLSEALGRHPHLWSVPKNEPPPEAAADEEAGRIPRPRREPDDRDRHIHVGGPLPGHRPRDDHERLPRHHEPHEGTRLQEREKTGERVRPGAQRVGDVLHQLLQLQVVELVRDQPPAYQHDGGDHREPHPLARGPRHLHQMYLCGALTIAPAYRGGNATAARSAAGRSGNSPNAVGPDPVTSAAAAPTSLSASSASAISGRSERAARSRSFTSKSAYSSGGAPDPAASRSAASAFSNPAASRNTPILSASAYTAAVSSPSSCGTRTTANSPGSASAATCSPDPPTSAKRGSSCEVTSAPSAAAIRSRSSRSPARCRRTAAASALPPPSPAATGTRFSISTRVGGPSHPAARSAASAAAARFGPATPGLTTSSCSPSPAEIAIPSASERGQNSERSSWSPSSRRSPT